MNKKVRLMEIFGVVGASIFFIRYITSSFMIWRIRLTALVDLFLVVPFTFLIYYLVNKSLSEPQELEKNKTLSKNLKILSSIFLMIFFLGYGIHYSANAIDEYIVMVRNYVSSIPPDTYEVIHFYDELLGHAVLFLGYLGLMCAFIIKELKEAKKEKPARMFEVIVACFVGIIIGAGTAVAFIEATYFIEFLLAFSVLLLILLSLYFIKNREDPRCYLYTLLFLTGFVSILITTLIYYFIFGGLIPLSQL